MTQVAEDLEFKNQMAELERLLEQVSAIPDSAARDTTSRIIQSLMDFHGAGLSRILEHLAHAGENGRQLMNDLAADDLVSGLLLLYGLHPLDLETRVKAALEKVRPHLGSHGGNVKLLEI